VVVPELSDRVLNRALLERQWLRERRPATAVEAVGHLVGLQAQEPRDPYVGLWCRLDGFDPEELARALLERQVVRIALQRSTIHLVTAEDCLALRPVLQQVQERMVRGQFGRRTSGIDLGGLAAATRELMAAEPLTFGELGKRLVERWPGREEMPLAQTGRALVPLGRSGRALHVPAEDWLGRPLSTATEPDGMVLRYLRAFGPASVADVQNWSGLTRLREVVERLDLRSFRAVDGRVLHDVPDGVLPEEDLPVPPRLLPQFDNVLLGHADRGRIVPPGAAALWTEEAHWSPVLVDGMVHGVWRLATERGSATLHARFLAPPADDDERAVAAEATALLELLAPKAAERHVRLG
jgi:hypothetical protein